MKRFNLKDNWKFVSIFAVVVLLFQWKLIAMKGFFLGGDNLLQFYPWFKVYSDAVKDLTFPFWTRYMQSGFPLMAEGQVGGYYPFNILFFFVLPFNAAYNYSVVFHFLIAGVSIYLLVRKLGACEWGGTLSAIIFCFGSAYAGCFYNIITLRTLSWTPLVFVLFEYFFEKQRPRYIIIASVIFGMQLLAGFVQLALYCWIFYVVYYLYRVRFSKTAWYLLPFSVISFIMFLPQLLITYKLIGYSARSAASLQFALWGSFNPMLIIEAVFPYLPGFTISEFYFSVLGVLFLIASFYLIKFDKKLMGIFIIFILSLFLSLGSYNPLYVMLMKFSKLYVFRNPSKFLFFSALTASVLIGRGFSEFMKDNFKHRKSALKVYIVVLCLSGAIFMISKIIVTYFRDVIIKIGEWYVTQFIFGTPAHRHGLDVYLQKMHQIYSLMIDGTSLKNVFNIVSWALLLSAIVISLLIIGRRNMRMPAYSRGVVVSVVVMDLFIYSLIGRGVRDDVQNPDALKPTHKSILNYIRNDKDLFRVMPYSLSSGKLPMWITPNSNIIYGIDSIAAYTPLTNRGYKNALAQLEIIDDSTGVISPKNDSMDNSIDIIRALNVKYVVSSETINKPFLKLLLEEEGVYLYELLNGLPRAFIVRSMDLDSLDSNIKIKMIEYSSGKASFKVGMPYRGYLVFSENNYPGWKAYVNGEERKVQPFLLINAVELDKGENAVSFRYDAY